MLVISCGSIHKITLRPQPVDLGFHIFNRERSRSWYVEPAALLTAA